MSNYMRAAVFTDINRVELKDLPIPEPGPGEALVKVMAAGLCATDVHVIKGWFAHSTPPVIMGHEVAGKIVAFGDIQPWPTELKVDDRVVVETMLACGKCKYCLSGFKNLCTYGGDIGETGRPGGYCQYIKVPVGCLYKIPNNMSYAEACIFESFVCPIGGLQRLGVTQADTVLIQGLGPAGLAFIQGARLMGAKTIIASGHGELRLKLARQYGANIVIDPREQDLKETVYNASKDGVEISCEASGNEKAIINSIELCAKNAKVLFYGIPNDSHNTRFDVTQIIIKQLNLFGISGAPWAWAPTLALYGAGHYNISDMITHRFALEDINLAIETLLDKSQNAIKIVLEPN